MRPRPVRLFTGLPFALASLCATALSLLGAGPARAMDDAALRGIVERRLVGDATGACFAVAVIDGDTTARSYVCADAGDPTRRIDADTAFEIGSVSKPMMAALLAGLIREGKASLDDPLSAYLPEGAVVPAFEDKPILLRHIVTHTSGLPAIPGGIDYDPANPYAKLTEADLLGALAKTRLARAPGASFEYSNFAAMLLSYAIARRSGEDFESLIAQRLFAPLGMRHSYVARRPEGVKVATGHTPDGKATSPWDFPNDFAGVGGVRATLDDMVRYVRGQFGDAPAPLATDVAMTHAPVAGAAQPPMAMHWMLAPLNGRTFLAHEGGTGGFSSFVAFDPAKRFGVVILSDTALHAQGGLGSLGLHLLDPRVPLSAPAKPRPADVPTLSADDLKAYAGDYPLMPGFVLNVRIEGATLMAQASGQGAFPLEARGKDTFAFDGAGIVIRFRRDAAGTVAGLALDQAGRTLEADRQ
jgi:D-alanyl-D-alanine-carboxypeptidase/D-alanyl-D-alanine-endopeptidase